MGRVKLSRPEEGESGYGNSTVRIVYVDGEEVGNLWGHSELVSDRMQWYSYVGVDGWHVDFRTVALAREGIPALVDAGRAEKAAREAQQARFKTAMGEAF